jgi:hypothetical protein
MAKAKRKYLGDDVWETLLPDGDTLLEIGCTKEQAAAFNADAEAAGLTVSDLFKMRCLGKYDEIELLTRTREIETMKLGLDSMMQESAVVQEAVEVCRSDPKRRPGLIKALSAAPAHFKSVLERLTAVEDLARKGEFHDVLARVSALKAVILKHADLISEVCAEEHRRQDRQ